jgi:hypothetical protein
MAKRGVPTGVLITAVAIVALHIALYVIYLNYLKRLESAKCECAASHKLFPWLKFFAMAVIVLTFAVPAAKVLLYSVGLVVDSRPYYAVFAIAMAAVVVKWYMDMHELKCACSDGIEKHLWFATSAVHLAMSALAVVSSTVYVVS